MTTRIKPINFSKFNSNPFYSRAYWSSLIPAVNVNSKQNDHITTVLHTFVKDLETGLITFDMVTPSATDTPLVNSNPKILKRRIKFFEIWSKKTGTFSK